MDTSKIKNAAVGLADLASNSVDSTKIKNGSIAEADLNAALLARLADLESRLAAVEGGPYSIATFKATYRCKSLNGGIDATTSFAAAEFLQNTSLVVADGNGSMTSSYAEHAIRRGWSVAGNTLATNQANWSEEGGPNTGTYNVSADGELTAVGVPVAPGAGEYGTGLLASNGDVVVFHWGNDEVNDGLSQSDREFGVCVRTSR